MTCSCRTRHRKLTLCGLTTSFCRNCKQYDFETIQHCDGWQQPVRKQGRMAKPYKNWRLCHDASCCFPTVLWKIHWATFLVPSLCNATGFPPLATKHTSVHLFQSTSHLQTTLQDLTSIRTLILWSWHRLHKQKDILPAEHIIESCASVWVISSAAPTQLHKALKWKHYKYQTKYAKQILLWAMHGCVDI